jgi:hypothetical protein
MSQDLPCKASQKLEVFFQLLASTPNIREIQNVATAFRCAGPTRTVKSSGSRVFSEM